MVHFKLPYFALAVFIFITEILIALFVHDQLVRPYIGDLLVVILIYCFLKAFLVIPVRATALAVLLFSFAVELLQYWNIVEVLGLQHSKLARIIIGTSFAWTDLLMYVLGIAIVLVAERVASNKTDVQEAH